MFSERIKELRKSKGVSQVEFAKYFHISTGTIGNWEIGAREPDYKMLQKIADYFNVSVDYLLGREEKEKSTGFPVDYGVFREELAKRNINEQDFEKLTDEQKKSLFNVVKELINSFNN